MADNDVKFRINPQLSTNDTGSGPSTEFQPGISPTKTYQVIKYTGTGELPPPPVPGPFVEAANKYTGVDANGVPFGGNPDPGQIPTDAKFSGLGPDDTTPPFYDGDTPLLLPEEYDPKYRLDIPSEGAADPATSPALKDTTLTDNGAVAKTSDTDINPNVSPADIATLQNAIVTGAISPQGQSTRPYNYNIVTSIPELADINITNKTTRLSDPGSTSYFAVLPSITPYEVSAAIQYRNAFKGGTPINDLINFYKGVEQNFFTQSPGGGFSVDSIWYWVRKHMQIPEVSSFATLGAAAASYYTSTTIQSQPTVKSAVGKYRVNLNSFFTCVSDSIGLLTNSKYHQLDSTQPIFDVAQQFYGVPIPFSANMENKIGPTARNLIYNLSKYNTAIYRRNLMGVAYYNPTYQENLKISSRVAHSQNLVNDIAFFVDFAKKVAVGARSAALGGTITAERGKLLQFVKFISNIGNQCAMNLRDIYPPINGYDRDFTVTPGSTDINAGNLDAGAIDRQIDTVNSAARADEAISNQLYRSSNDLYKAGSALALKSGESVVFEGSRTAGPLTPVTLGTVDANGYTNVKNSRTNNTIRVPNIPPDPQNITKFVIATSYLETSGQISGSSNQGPDWGLLQYNYNDVLAAKNAGVPNPITGTYDYSRATFDGIRSGDLSSIGPASDVINASTQYIQKIMPNTYNLIQDGQIGAALNVSQRGTPRSTDSSGINHFFNSLPGGPSGQADTRYNTFTDILLGKTSVAFKGQNILFGQDAAGSDGQISLPAATPVPPTAVAPINDTETGTAAAGNTSFTPTPSNLQPIGQGTVNPVAGFNPPAPTGGTAQGAALVAAGLAGSLQPLSPATPTVAITSSKPYSNKQLIKPFSFAIRVEDINGKPNFIDVDYLLKKIVKSNYDLNKAMVNLVANKSIAKLKLTQGTPGQAQNSFTLALQAAGKLLPNINSRNFLASNFTGIINSLGGGSIINNQLAATALQQFQQIASQNALTTSTLTSGLGALASVAASRIPANILGVIGSSTGVYDSLVSSVGLGGLSTGSLLNSINPLNYIDVNINISSIIPHVDLGSLGEIANLAGSIASTGGRLSISSLNTIQDIAKQINRIICNFQLPSLAWPLLNEIVLLYKTKFPLKDLPGKIWNSIKKYFQDILDRFNPEKLIKLLVEQIKQEIQAYWAQIWNEILTCNAVNQQLKNGKPQKDVPKLF
jgi:hypothetical protein